MAAYRNPVPTVDIIIELPAGVVLIERKNEPHGWAIPGGFVDHGESVSAAAAREALEETSLEVSLMEQFFIYSDPARDPRLHTISTVFIATADGEPRAADDARAVGLFTEESLPRNMCFDHGQIMADYFHYKRTGQRPPADR